jgi:hypothetical protein
MEALGPRIGQSVPQLLPLFLQLSRDESDELRNNVIFGIGEMFLHGKEALFRILVQDVLSPGVKRSGREADHSPPCRAEVKNAWSYISTPPTRFHGVMLR